MAERGAGRQSWSLSAQMTQPYRGQGQTMSETGVNVPSGWFGPLTPLAPIAPPEVAGRQWDFPSGYNLVVRPRAYEPTSFADLRMLADSYDLLRLVIETRKDQVERIGWGFKAKEGRKVSNRRIDRAQAFFDRPDGEHDFASWLRILLEDLFVLDAPTIWRQRDRGGELIALHPLDGATIKRVIDDWGRTPRPFAENGELIYPAAYQQVLKGYPAVDYTARDIFYAPRNLRSGRVYGFSPVEQIMMTVAVALRRQTFQLSYYTEGNIPESLIGVPETWTPDQIKNFQDYWDAYFTGDLAARRRAKFVPGGVAKTFIQTKEPELKNVFDEWLARVVCFAFSISPLPFVNQGNRAESQTQKDLSEEEGLFPVLSWVKRLIDRVLVEDIGETEIEFKWGDDDQDNPAELSNRVIALVGAGLKTRNEAREMLGDNPITGIPEMDQPMITTATGVVPLNSYADAQERADQIASQSAQTDGGDNKDRAPE